MATGVMPAATAARTDGKSAPSAFPGGREVAARGVRKAAMLMVILGEQASAEVFRELNEDEAQLVGREVARLNSITSEQAVAVLEEFYQMTLAREYVLKGGVDYARKILINAFGPDTAKKLMDRMIKALGTDTADFDVLHKADPQQLAKFIHSEHPQTIALILSHLVPAQAAALLTSLPPEMRLDVTRRMADLEQISPEIINKIAGVIGQKLKALGEFSRESYGGVRAVSEMLNRLDSGLSEEILANLAETSAPMADTIRQFMFVFEDFLTLGQESLKTLLGKVDRKQLTVALKGTSSSLQEHFLRCMSQRGAEMLREDMEALGPTRIKDVEAAQQQIIGVARQLQAAGAISLKGSASEQYVM